MGCRPHEEFNTPEDLQHREAAQLRIALKRFQGEPIPETLPSIASGHYRSSHQVMELCAEIRNCGETPYLRELMEAHPLDPDAAGLYAWWLKHEAADNARKQEEAVAAQRAAAQAAREAAVAQRRKNREAAAKASAYVTRHTQGAPSPTFTRGVHGSVATAAPGVRKARE